VIDFRNFRSLEEALADAPHHKQSLLELASLSQSEIQKISESAVAEDWYGDMPLIKPAVREIWKTPDAASFIAHSIWCAHREARWLLKTGNYAGADLAYHFDQPEYFIKTGGKPTIIIAPMTLGTHDAFHLMLTALSSFQSGRRVVFYGENMDHYLALYPEHKPLFADDSIAGIKQIIETLRSGGLFLTYPDFVYQKHAVIQGQLFGLPRSFSSSFLKIVLKSSAELLPVTCLRSGDGLQMRFYPPIAADKNDEYVVLPEFNRLQLQCLLVGKILERLIVQVPNQWRLLPTLTHTSEEMA